MSQLFGELLTAQDGDFLVVADGEKGGRFCLIFVKEGRLWYPHRDSWDTNIGTQSDVLARNHLLDCWNIS